MNCMVAAPAAETHHDDDDDDVKPKEKKEKKKIPTAEDLEKSRRQREKDLEHLPKLSADQIASQRAIEIGMEAAARREAERLAGAEERRRTTVHARSETVFEFGYAADPTGDDIQIVLHDENGANIDLVAYLPELEDMDVKKAAADDEEKGEIHVDKKGVLRIPETLVSERPKRTDKEEKGKKEVLDSILEIVERTVEHAIPESAAVKKAAAALEVKLPSLAGKPTSTRAKEYRPLERKVIDAERKKYEAITARLITFVTALKEEENIDLTTRYSKAATFEDRLKEMVEKREEELRERERSGEFVFPRDEHGKWILSQTPSGEKEKDMGKLKRAMAKYSASVAVGRKIAAADVAKIGQPGLTAWVRDKWQFVKPAEGPAGLGVATVVGVNTIFMNLARFVGLDKMYDEWADWLTFGYFKEGPAPAKKPSGGAKH